MKTKTLIAFFISFASLQLFAGGNGIGNGGDIVSLQFVQIARHGVTSLATEQISVESKKLVQQISDAVDSTLVTSENNLFLGEREVDAINYPDAQKIEVSRSRWSFFEKENMNTKVMLVFHEYLGILKLDDSSYELSTSLLQGIAIPELPNQYAPLLDAPVLMTISENHEVLSLQVISASLNIVKVECSMNDEPYKICAMNAVFNRETKILDTIQIRITDSKGRVSAVATRYWTHIM